MAEADLNLLIALDALLATGSVAGAARRLGLSASATSRALARLRVATGDPLLVRAGRGLAPTTHAEALRERARDLAQEARALLRPAVVGQGVEGLRRTFTIRANEGFVETVGARLVATVIAEAPGARVRFAPKPDKDVGPLREGRIDLDIGVLGESGPEIRVQALFRDEFIAAARTGHPLLDGELTPARYAAFGHVVASRRGVAAGPVDDALAELGLKRNVVVIAPSFAAALAIARGTDLVALVTRSFLDEIGSGMRGVSLPMRVEGITVSQMWHPRLEADPAHRWLRGKVREACAWTTS